MWTIEKEFHFYAGHRIESLGSHHKCARFHGHTYRVRLTIAGDKLNGPGFLREFADLDHFEQWIKMHLDHKTLNDFPAFATVEPTTERLAEMLFEVAKSFFPETVSVAVSETEKTWVTYHE